MNGVSIELRAAKADERYSFGHLEIDIAVGKTQRQAALHITGRTNNRMLRKKCGARFSDVF